MQQPANTCLGMQCPETGLDLIMWKNKPVTAVVFGSGLLFYFALFSLEYSLLLLVCRLTQLGLLLALGAKLTGRNFPVSQQAAREHHARVSRQLQTSLDNFLEVAYPVVSVESFAILGRAFVAVTLVGMVSSWFATSTLLLLSFIGAFLGPYIYQEKRDVIKPVLDQANAVLQQNLGKVMAMIPTAQKLKGQ